MPELWPSVKPAIDHRRQVDGRSFAETRVRLRTVHYVGAVKNNNIIIITDRYDVVAAKNFGRPPMTNGSTFGIEIKRRCPRLGRLFTFDFCTTDGREFCETTDPIRR